MAAPPDSPATRSQELFKVVETLQTFCIMGLVIFSGGVGLLLQSIQLSQIIDVLLGCCRPHVLGRFDCDTVAGLPPSVHMLKNPVAGVYLIIYQLVQALAVYLGHNGNFVKRQKAHLKNLADLDNLPYHYTQARSHTKALWIVLGTDSIAQRCLGLIPEGVEGGLATIKIAMRALLEISLMQFLKTIPLPCGLTSHFSFITSVHDATPLNRQLEMRMVATQRTTYKWPRGGQARVCNVRVFLLDSASAHTSAGNTGSELQAAKRRQTGSYPQANQTSISPGQSIVWYRARSIPEAQPCTSHDTEGR